MIAAMLALAAVAAPSPVLTRPDGVVVTASTVGADARRAMADTGAQGLAIAVIDDGRVAFVEAWGSRNAAGDPLTTDTVMYGASLTKAVFATFVMQLVSEKRIALDTPIADILAKPLPDYPDEDRYAPYSSLAGDDRWRRITPRILLTHSAGFANFYFLEPDEKLHIHFDPGTRYSYSGDGIILTQFTIEKGLGLDVGEEMQRRIFTPLGMTSTSLKWRPDFARNLADGWTAEGKVEPHDQRSRVRAAGSMDTTIGDLARFSAAYIGGTLLAPAARDEMLRPQLPITTASQFPTLQPDLPAAKRYPGLSAGVGVVTYAGPQGPGFFKGGHDDSTANTWVCVPARRRCVVILSNDVRAEAAFPALVRGILGDTGTPWTWEYGPAAATWTSPKP